MKNSLRKSRFKKFIFHKLFLSKLIKGASYVNFLNREEMTNSKFTNSNPIIVGNGVEIPKAALSKTKSSEKYLAFLGRYDVNHKGIDLLLSSINQIKSELRKSRTKIIMHGVTHSNEDDLYINNYVLNNGLNDIVSILGPIKNEEKNKFLSNAAYYILTSRYEGLPLTVLEALANNTPVIVTPETNMVKTVKDNRLGFTVEDSITESDNVSNIGKTILKALEVDSASFYCEDYVRKNLSWEGVYKMHLKNYYEYK
nr:hypothetical protein BCU67_21435 [Vibrio cyclitrophicus]